MALLPSPCLLDLLLLVDQKNHSTVERQEVQECCHHCAVTMMLSSLCHWPGTLLACLHWLAAGTVAAGWLLGFFSTYLESIFSSMARAAAMKPPLYQTLLQLPCLHWLFDALAAWLNPPHNPKCFFIFLNLGLAAQQPLRSKRSTQALRNAAATVAALLLQIAACWMATLVANTTAKSVMILFPQLITRQTLGHSLLGLLHGDAAACFRISTSFLSPVPFSFLAHFGCHPLPSTPPLPSTIAISSTVDRRQSLSCRRYLVDRRP